MFYIKNIFDNPKSYLNEILNNTRINNIKRLDGKSFVCAFFTKKCRVGCKFCFFKSNFKNLDDIEETYEMSEYGFEKFIEFINNSNNGYLLISGGGEPFEKSDYVLRTVKLAVTDRIVIVTNGFWAKKYNEAKKMIDNIYNNLKSRDKIIPIVLRLSFDKFHYKNLGEEIYKNIIDIFSKYYYDDEYFKLKIHTIMEDDTLYEFCRKNNYIIDNKFVINSSDNNKIFKLMPKKFNMFIDKNYSIDVSAAKLFYPTVKPDLTHNINKKAIDVFDEDIVVSESYNPSRVTNINGNDGLDFWINYNGNVTTWQNEQKNNIYNIYVDDYKTIEDKTYNNILSYSVIDKGYYYREQIINEVNKKAVLRSKLSNMRDLSTSLLLNETKTNLYYAIRVIQDYKNNINIYDLNSDIRKIINLSKNEIIDLYNKSNYCIIDEYIEEDASEEEWRDLFDLIRLAQYDVSNDSLIKALNFFNKKFDTNYKNINDIEVIDKFNQNDRIIEKLTRMKKDAKETCLFYRGLQTNNIKILSDVPKADLHAHSTRSGDIRYFEKKYNTKIKKSNHFSSIYEMNEWYDKNIKILFHSELESFEQRLKSAFLAAKKDNIKKLQLSFGVGNLKIFNGNIDNYINKIEEIRMNNYDGIFIPELCLVRENGDNSLYKKIIDKNYFKSLDLVGDETLGVDEFIDIYSYAKSKNIILRCHVGEFSSSNYVDDAIEKLNLDEIQHGLSLVSDEKLIKKIKERGIRVNLCPASNMVLGTVREYSYPLHILLDNKINVSINTDDLLIFNKTISEIFLDLYNTRQFSIEQLNNIRMESLK